MMLYIHYTTDAGNALQAMELPKNDRAVILGKHLNRIYHELRRNRTGGVYTGNEAHWVSVNMRLGNTPSPTLDGLRSCGKL
ncbi:MAG: hypothetical protein LBK00_06740 [Treponema sp.]|jgi:IS30 family transposase|nr:hypothetical protein [Treponema sp.]